MSLLKDGIFQDDPWNHADDDAPVAADADVYVGLDRLEAEFATLADRPGRLGALLDSDLPVERLAPYLDALSLVALRFPAFTDGRAYSSARLLRDRHRFDGEVRAVGDVLADQYAFMLRCGFDAFEVPDGQPPELWRRAAAAISLDYQRGYVARFGSAPRNILDARRIAQC